jgi:hypothetical protein
VAVGHRISRNQLTAYPVSALTWWSTELLLVERSKVDLKTQAE